ncbi:hypothetical protein BBD42_15335 [Paenibacillus sp. BIHB 4019]|uniref:Phage ABA sandwich domain-containing protein n=1 Tax=Paenibacillus sp. BIHB 4019 TaxID=1870819 RepID=A0A1B2DJ34_9BACL|nr:hypothetical protein [Paenibacillus sp. BIHB 4019]ANY67685.1 hypothetical protein BBD42_15335 [Paenibacillus sp. BIHB 4019]
MKRKEVVEKWCTLRASEHDAWVASAVMGAEVIGGNVEKIPEGFRPVPRYTASISEAWKVVEKVREDWILQLLDGAGWWSVVLLSDCEDRSDIDPVNLPTASEAICLAALIAKLTKE